MSAFSTLGATTGFGSKIANNVGIEAHSPRLVPAPETVETVNHDGTIVHDSDVALVGAGAGLRDVVERIEQVAKTDTPVLLEGETGSGKELVARRIHARSSRPHGPMIRVNCGAIPSELIDSQLFGHERGSFSGATATRLGWFERAHGGTLFLDEIGELSLAAQVRLLRVLQDGSLERVGGGRSLAVDVRIITATHRDLRAMCNAGTFRADLWYRISTFSVRIPPLRERRDDIPALATHFAHRAGTRLTGVPLVPTEAELATLGRYAWPGNVRELAAVIERAAILGGGRRLDVDAALGDGIRAIPEAQTPAPTGAAFPTLDDAVRHHIGQALALTGGRIEGKGGAADVLGLNPHTLRGKMRKLKIDWASFRRARVEL